MKIKKATLTVITLMLSLACVFCFPATIRKASAKTIYIYKGKTHKLKIKKGSKISVSDPEIAKVSKKGKITALKKGKCTVKVKKGKKVKKYKVVVQKMMGGLVSYQGLIVDRIEPNDDATAKVFLEITEDCSLKYSPATGQCKYVECEVPQEDISAKGIQAGDNVTILVHVFDDKQNEIVSDTYVINKRVDISKR